MTLINALLTLAHARDSGCNQRSLRRDPLGMVAHQHRNIAWRQQPIPQRGGIRQQPANLCCHADAGECSGVSFGYQLPGFLPVYGPEYQRCCHIAVHQVRRGRRRDRFVKRDLVKNKAARRRTMREHGIHRLDQLRRSAVIGVQCVTMGSASTSFKIGKKICTPKRIDCLFGVTDQKDRLRASTVDCIENLVLHRVGILKLIQQRCLIIAAQLLQQCITDTRLHCCVQVQQQIIVGLYAALGFQLALCSIGATQHLVQPGHVVSARSILISRNTRKQRIDLVKKRMYWWVGVLARCRWA